MRRKHEEAMALREKGRKRRGAGRKEAARARGRWSPAARFAGAAVLEEEERSGAAASRKMAGRWRRCSGPSWSRSSEEGLGDEGDRVLQVGLISVGMDPKEEDRWVLVVSELKPRERVAAARRNEEDGTSCLISRVGSRVYIAGGFG